MVALDVAVVVVVALLAVLVAGLLRSHAEILQALHQLGVDMSPGRSAGGVTTPVSLGARGTGAGPGAGGPGGAGPGAGGAGPGGASGSKPEFGRRPTPGRPDPSEVFDVTGVTPAGDAVSIPVSAVGHDTLLAFLTSGCATCRGIWDALRSGGRQVPGAARLVAVTRGPEAESPGALAGLGGERIPIVMSTAAWDSYDVPHAPYFIYVSGPAARVVGEGSAATWEQVVELLGFAALDAEAARRAPTPGAVQGAATSSTERREQRIDAELSAAGIHPGDPRLHPRTINDGGGQ